jgi:RHH-type transcriptional regulator, proline utilization regulon repressor / proline dehydrogenase / delta 1-pyrroline-5-carboxylate dehydrogenase
VKRLGEPVIRTAVGRAMKEMGRNFVLGETIEAAMKRAEELEGKGYSYSYDMLGEAARTEGDARRYHLAYSAAITAIARAARAATSAAIPAFR